MKYLTLNLQTCVVPQATWTYTDEDRETWRLLYNECTSNMRNTSNKICLNGLRKLGLRSDELPQIDKITEHLAKFGWKAIPVKGLIDGEAFLTFLSLKMLPVAINVRSRRFLTHSPEPDIFHEAFGHACLIPNKAYREFLERYGKLARHAIRSAAELELSKMVSKLCALKADTNTSNDNNVAKLEKAILKKRSSIKTPSELEQLNRLSWWTVECGLLRQGTKYCAYGAALLSSIQEGSQFVSNSIKKIRLSMECAKFPIVPDKMQSTLFYITELKELSTLLDSFERQMAFTRGGSEGLAKAIVAGSEITVVIDNMTTVQGVVKRQHINKNGEVVSFYIRPVGAKRAIRKVTLSPQSKVTSVCNYNASAATKEL